MRVRTLGSLGVILLFAAHLAGQTPTQLPGSAMPGPASRPQTPAPPPRDNTANSPVGTASISGRVFAADSGVPLRQAQVRISGNVRGNAAAVTDGEGRYEFSSLPAGRYAVFASRAGYVNLQYGQERTNQPGKMIEISQNGQRVEKIDIALPKGGVITGRITDPWGEPAPGLRVQTLRWAFTSKGERQLSPYYGGNGSQSVTDDLGQFRVYGLMPGEYAVSASPMNGMMSEQNVGGVVASGVDADGFLTSYYPGTSSAQQAQSISVQSGRETSVFFAMSSGRLSRITGTVRNSQGRPFPNAQVMLRVTLENGFSTSGGGGTGPDGTFTLMNVQPGDYTLDIRPRMMGNVPGQPPNAAEQEFASVPVSVNGADITGLVITTGTGSTVSGRLVFDGSAPRNLASVRMNLVYSPPNFGPMNGPNQAVVDESGNFQMRGVAGKVLFRPMIPPGWALKSVTLDGADITDVAYDIRRNIANVEIVLTDRVTNVSGTVRNFRGELLKEFVVLTFPSDTKDGIVLSRFMQVSRPNPEGRFLFRTLPPGDYVIAAVEALDELTQQFNPEFQRFAKERGTRVNVREGQPVTVDLQIIQ